MKRMSILYDISSTKRRNRLVKILEQYGERVQLSVFEFRLTKARHVELMQTLKNEEFLMDEHPDYPNDKLTIYYHEDTGETIERYGETPTADKDNLFYM